MFRAQFIFLFIEGEGTKACSYSVARRDVTIYTNKNATHMASFFFEFYYYSAFVATAATNMRHFQLLVNAVLPKQAQPYPPKADAAVLLYQHCRYLSLSTQSSEAQKLNSLSVSNAIHRPSQPPIHLSSSEQRVTFMKWMTAAATNALDEPSGGPHWHTVTTARVAASGWLLFISR